MKITDDKTLEKIQQEFNAKFPYLKLEFYWFPHGEGDGSPESQKIDPSLTIGATRTVHNSGDVSINGNLKVSTLENNFKEMYGLNAQVFRRSGTIYLQTISTDEWTLAEQNTKGAQSVQQV